MKLATTGLFAGLFLCYAAVATEDDEGISARLSLNGQTINAAILLDEYWDLAELSAAEVVVYQNRLGVEEVADGITASLESFGVLAGGESYMVSMTSPMVDGYYTVHFNFTSQLLRMCLVGGEQALYERSYDGSAVMRLRVSDGRSVVSTEREFRDATMEVLRHTSRFGGRNVERRDFAGSAEPRISGSTKVTTLEPTFSPAPSELHLYDDDAEGGGQ